MYESEQSTLPRKRVTSDASRVAREASALVRPVNAKIGEWLAEAVRLEMSAQRARAAGQAAPGIPEALATLLVYVEEETLRFEELVGETASDIALHGRVADTRQGLGMLAERVRRAIGQKPD